MKDLTQEQFDTLTKYTDSLNEAKAGYYRAFLMSDAAVMNDIYTELTGQSENITCGRCILTILKTLSAAYDKFVEDHKSGTTPTPEPAPRRRRAITKKQQIEEDEANH